MIFFTLLTVIFPAAWGCAPATGGISNGATLHFSLSPPPKYTYSDFPADGQKTSAKAAEDNADKDLRSAILSTLTENGIPAEMATLQYEYSAPKLLLAEGSHCVEPGTYVVYDGAIVYKCVERVLAVRSRGKREVSSTIAVSTTATTDVQTTTGEETTTNSEIITELPTTTDAETTPGQSTTPGPDSTTKLPTTTDAETTLEPTTTKSSPDSPSTKSPTTTNPKTTSEHETTTKSFPETEVKAEQFEITGAVVVKTQQPIFESQWNLLAAEIQAKLEKHRVLFTEDIRVELI